MEEKKLRDAFEHLNPSEQEKREMFYRIQNAGRRKKGRTMRVGVAAALIALIVAVSGVGIDAATGGKVMQTIREACGWGGNCGKYGKYTAKRCGSVCPRDFCPG